MGYRLKPDKTVQKNIRRIAREQIDKALGEINDPELDRHEAIHQVRKRCKKLRGLLRLVRPELGKVYQRENARFRNIARNLAGMRDEQSMVEALERLLSTLEDNERGFYDPVLSALRTKRNAVAASTRQDPASLLADARQALEKARKITDSWRLSASGFKAVHGFDKTYKRGRMALSNAYQTKATDDFHEWRKRVKYHSHHLQLLGPLWPRVNRAWQNESRTLADILGNDHDLALLDALLESDSGQLAENQTRQSLQIIIRKEQRHLRKQAWKIGQRLYAESPGAFRKRWKRYWKSWQTEQ